MGFGQRWPERVRRPKARHLAEGEKDEILATLRKAIAASPVLSSFGVEVQLVEAVSILNANGGR